MVRPFLYCLGLIAILCLSFARVDAAVFDVRAHGAAGDGKTLDTAAIHKAIAAAHAAGGGTVYFPPGTYLSGSIHLESHITLYLESGATIEATADPQAYDPPEPNQWDRFQDFGHSHWHNSLIWGENLEDIAILGPGLIYGKGLTREGGQRVGNKAIALKLCRNVVIRDISILMAGHFGILASGVDNLTIDNLKIDTNRDGINIDACRNVRISNCSVNSPWDDAIVLKSSYALGFARATENLTITNCQVSGFDRGTFLGGKYEASEERAPDGEGATGRIKMGTESNGGFKNIAISNCVFVHCRGLALETVDGGLLEDIVISNLTMRDIVNAPIFLRLGSRLRAPKGATVGALRRVMISNMLVYNADPRFASIISGIPGHDVEDVKLSGIRIYYRGGGAKELAAVELPEKENGYPEPAMFGDTPSYGFYIRHAKGIEMEDVEVSYMKEDLRPAFVLQDVKGVTLTNVNAQHAPGVGTFALKDVANFALRLSRTLPDTRIESVKRKSF